jgi:thiamine-triphosphatase
VEQKFVLNTNTSSNNGTTAVLKRLQQAGLREHGSRHMVDWYYDIVVAAYPLIRQDCWLRYRCGYFNADGVATSSSESNTAGQWELKRGNRESASSTNGGSGGGTATSRATVYQELEGVEALHAVQELLADLPPHPTLESSTTADTKNLLAKDLYEIPQPPIAIPGLQAFARIITHRSSWSLPPKDNDNNSAAVGAIVVDLDTTDFGYAVGEVERLVTNSSDIAAARRDLATWLVTVLGEEALAGPPPVGKLEYYLQTRQPHVYDILVEEGLVVS